MKKSKKPKIEKKLEKLEKPLKIEKFKNLKNKMASFYFHQFAHEIFWQYLSRLNEFHTQCVDYYFEKWKIYQVIFEGLNDEYRAMLRLYAEGVWIVYSLRLKMRFGISFKN